MNEIEVLLAAMDRADWDVFLVAGRYTLLEQGALTELLPRCGAAGSPLPSCVFFSVGCRGLKLPTR